VTLRTLLKGLTRSPRWWRVRKTHLAAHSDCAACGGVKKPEVHHIHPFHLAPERELDPTNLVTLCESSTACHFLIGHGKDWKAFNPTVREDARHIRDLVATRQYGQ